jgi:hypothetical protein
MANKKEMTKDERVKKEIIRLNKIYKDLPRNTIQLVEGLIVQAARHRVDLDDAWLDMDEKGKVEMFSQSPNTEPYERERPVVRHYFQTDKQYQSALKQLDGYLPDDKEKPEDDGFDSFMMER